VTVAISASSDGGSSSGPVVARRRALILEISLRGAGSVFVRFPSLSKSLGAIASIANSAEERPNYAW